MTTLVGMIRDIYEVFQYDSCQVKPTRWQAMDVKDQPAALMHEMLHVNLEADIDIQDLKLIGAIVKPNLPWADNHFEERVSGHAMNPGTEWANWPWGVNAEKSLDSHGQFNHNYMERYWPRRARSLVGIPTKSSSEVERELHQLQAKDSPVLWGIRHPYGDLASLVRDLSKEPDTRQAYLPVWFPEDTGDAHKGRKPCTLGYHFIMRNDRLDVVYYMRSCDLAHHFRDDVYLTIRLARWVLRMCQILNPQQWGRVKRGKLVMQITSLHMFTNDFRKLYPEEL